MKNNNEAKEKGLLYGSASAVSALFGVPKIGAATATLGSKTLSILGVASALNPVTAAIAGGVIIGAVTWALTKK